MPSSTTSTSSSTAAIATSYPSKLSAYRPARPSPLSTSVSATPEDSYSPLAKPTKMSILQTQMLARRARSKLAFEAQRQDHEMRRLVGHANLLDVLVRYLVEAEREQERWFNDAMEDAQSTHFVDARDESIGYLPMDDDIYDSTSSEEESDDEDGDYEDDDAEFTYSLTRTTSHKNFDLFQSAVTVSEIMEDAVTDESDYDEEDDDEDEGDEEGLYPLKRTYPHSPPALVDDSSSSEDEDSNPPSPRQTIVSTSPSPASLWSTKQDAESVPRIFGSSTPAAIDEHSDGISHPELYATVIESF